MNGRKRALLMVAFGGPIPGCCDRFMPCPGEAYCFVSGILGHNPARRQRIAEVAAHYADFGGYSRFNDYTRAQAEALSAELASRDLEVPVWCGFHHWRPYVRDVISEMKTAGVREMLVLVMAPHQSSVSWDLYLRVVGEGIREGGSRGADGYRGRGAVVEGRRVYRGDCRPNCGGGAL